jgi:DNA-3-methyladenine glycosylase II
MEKIKQYLSEKDPLMAEVIKKVELPTIEPHNDIYAELLGSIISQQLSVKAAATIEGRFLDLFPDRKPLPQSVLDTHDDILRGVGLSYQKAGYIKNIARYWLDNNAHTRDWLTMHEDDIITELTQIKGVGKWTVQMILMFRLCRLDVFPIDDLGIRQGMVKIYNVEETGKALIQKLHQLSDTWRPYRSVACRYVWRYKDTFKD